MHPGSLHMPTSQNQMYHSGAGSWTRAHMQRPKERELTSVPGGARPVITSLHTRRQSRTRWLSPGDATLWFALAGGRCDVQDSVWERYTVRTMKEVTWKKMFAFPCANSPKKPRRCSGNALSSFIKTQVQLLLPTPVVDLVLQVLIIRLLGAFG